MPEAQKRRIYWQSVKNRSATKERCRDDEMNGLISAARAGAVRAAVAYYSSQYRRRIKVGYEGKHIQVDEPEHPHSPFMMMVLVVLVVIVVVRS
jgi:hypothetical protein